MQTRSYHDGYRVKNLVIKKHWKCRPSATPYKRVGIAYFHCCIPTLHDSYTLAELFEFVKDLLCLSW